MANNMTVYTVDYDRRCVIEHSYGAAAVVEALRADYYDNYDDALAELEEFVYEAAMEGQ